MLCARLSFGYSRSRAADGSQRLALLTLSTHYSLETLGKLVHHKHKDYHETEKSPYERDAGQDNK